MVGLYGFGHLISGGVAVGICRVPRPALSEAPRQRGGSPLHRGFGCSPLAGNISPTHPGGNAHERVPLERPYTEPLADLLNDLPGLLVWSHGGTNEGAWRIELDTNVYRGGLASLEAVLAAIDGSGIRCGAVYDRTLPVEEFQVKFVLASRGGTSPAEAVERIDGEWQRRQER